MRLLILYFCSQGGENDRTTTRGRSSEDDNDDDDDISINGLAREGERNRQKERESDPKR